MNEVSKSQKTCSCVGLFWVFIQDKLWAVTSVLFDHIKLVNVVQFG